MTSWVVFRAKACRVLGIGLAIAGFVQAALFTCRSLVSNAIPDPLLEALPQPPSALLIRMHKIIWIPEGLHLALIAAMFGVALIALGGWIARSQVLAIEDQRRRREDARRRVQHYRESTRIEPTF
jgi:hypothetical protein